MVNFLEQFLDLIPVRKRIWHPVAETGEGAAAVVEEVRTGKF